MPDTAAAIRPTIAFQPERHRRVLAGHPWAYSNEITMTPSAKGLEPGTLVTLAGAGGEKIGTAMFNPRPLISARMLTREVGAPIDRAFLARRLGQAVALRQTLYDAPHYRLIHAEADGLPGVLADRSKAALALAAQGAALNGVADRCTVMEDDGFSALERLAQANERFDVVVADPPAFVKSRKDLAVGIRAYRKLTRLAAALVRPRGFLFVASCSHNVEPEAFSEQVCGGLSPARRSGRILRLAGVAAQPHGHSL